MNHQIGQIKVRHYSREKDQHTDRVLSPQRLMFYRNNWYLDAWCHYRQGLRRFSVDAFDSVDLLLEPAQDISLAELDAEFASSIHPVGIFYQL